MGVLRYAASRLDVVKRELVLPVTGTEVCDLQSAVDALPRKVLVIARHQALYQDRALVAATFIRVSQRRLFVETLKQALEQAVIHVFRLELVKHFSANLLQLLGLPPAAVAKVQVHRYTGGLGERQAP